MVMLGDETWIKLFPRLFTRQDGVSSFYVKDTVEVDFNVSRHLEAELAANDWNLLILHYLGLDHVGHIGGRNSVLMGPKLQEMDEIIRMIHRHAILHQDNIGKSTLLAVVSDHGMTDGGNHGGASYEESDSLALFVGLGAKIPGDTMITYNTVSQVDIAPTLAVLFGVPIPKNSVGVLIREILDSLKDEQRLRALELNSWQLLRLLQAQLSSLLCRDLFCTDLRSEQGPEISKSGQDETFCHLLTKAMDFHSSWKHLSDSNATCDDTEHLHVTIAAYYEFLRTASDWLSHRASNKPLNMLASGIAMMFISCIVLLNLLFCLFKEAHLMQKQRNFKLKQSITHCNLDDAFVFIGILIHVFSLASSSMVEEEQYIWHFLTSTMYLIFLFMTVQSFLGGRASNPCNKTKGKNHVSHQLCKNGITSISRFSDCASTLWEVGHDYFQICSVLMVLVCARIVRSCHQGGVNWTHLPDISKWLEQSGTGSIKSFQIASLLLVITLSLFMLSLAKPKRSFLLVLMTSQCISGFLVFLHIMGYQIHMVMMLKFSLVSLAQIFYVSLLLVVMMVLASPWAVPISHQKSYWETKLQGESHSTDMQLGSLHLYIRDSAYIIGGMYTASWCLLQLLLQQPINSVPVLLLLLQTLASMVYFSTNGSRHGQWVEVAAIYFLGMAGHFGLGNSNSLATVDVAGAFTGISSHSTVLAGILMFILTYASPLLFFLSMVLWISTKDIGRLLEPHNSNLSYIVMMFIGFPCLLPLVLNSLTLTAFTVILLAMSNHLFVWSVFSPKYLYVCAATVSVYIGVLVIALTGAYICIVLSCRAKISMLTPSSHQHQKSSL